ncbi:MAG: ATP-grasp domain-containing protein [Spirochaetota bacterium]
MLLDEAVADVRAHPPAGIITTWDYPANEVARHLSRMLGLPGPTLRSVLGWSHKYWARKIQERVTNGVVPEFAVADPFDPEAADTPVIDPPVWIKPVRATNSALAFRADTPEEYRAAIRRLKDGIDVFAQPLDYLMKLADLPRWFRAVDGRSCVVERSIRGRRCTVSAMVHDGHPRVLGVFDSHEDSSTSAFSAFTYPSRLPSSVLERLEDITISLLKANLLEESGFNVEYFYDPSSDAITILELNPRFSQSHAPLFEYVDGTSSLELLVDLATGHEPEFQPRSGRYATAGKFFLRRDEGGVVLHTPSPAEVSRIEHEFDCEIELKVAEGDLIAPRITGHPVAPAVAHIYLGADSFEGLDERFASIASRLELTFE